VVLSVEPKSQDRLTHIEKLCVLFALRSCKGDGGRPFEAALQGEASNRLKLLWPKAMVVSVGEKAHKMRQV